MLEMSFSYYVSDFDSRENGLRPPEGFEDFYQFYPSFNIVMVLLNHVVKTFILPDLNSFSSFCLL